MTLESWMPPAMTHILMHSKKWCNEIKDPRSFQLNQELKNLHEQLEEEKKLNFHNSILFKRTHIMQ